MLDRISKLIKEKKITPSQFADEIGVQRSSVSHVLSGRNKPSLDFVTKILTAYDDIDADWLLKGKGSMLRQDALVPDKQHERGSQTSMEVESGGDDRQIAGENEELSARRAGVVTKKTGRKALRTGDKRIDKIVLFYNDNTFTEFTPEQ